MPEAITAPEVTSADAAETTVVPDGRVPEDSASPGAADAAGNEGVAKPGAVGIEQARDEKGQFRQTSPAEKKLHRLKVNGREVEVPEEELIESGKMAAQMRRAAAEQFEASRRERAAFEALRKRVSEGDEEALAELMGGADKLDAAAEARLLRKLQLEQMNPDARARLHAEQRAAQAEAKAKALEEAQREREAKAQEAQEIARFDQEFTEALKTSGLPRTIESVRRMATLASALTQRGLEVNSRQVAAMVKRDMQAEALALIGSLDGDALLGLLGDDVLKKVRAADVARIKGAQAVQAPKLVAVPKPAAPESDEPNPHIYSRDEWERRMYGK